MAAAALTTSLAFVKPNLAEAAGPYIGDIDPVAMGMGGAFVASPSTTSAMHYNPAGLAGQQGLQLQFEFGMSLSQMAFTRMPEGATTFPTLTNREPFQPGFFAGASYDFKVPGLAVALAAWSPMSNQYGFGDTGPNRYQYIRADNVVFNVHLGAAYQVVRWLSFGATVGNTYFSTLQRLAVSAALAGDVEDLTFSTPLELQVNDPFTITSNFGVRVSPFDFLHIGLSFTPPFDVNASGTAKVEIPQALSSLVTVQGNKVQLALNMPFILRAGVRARVHERVALELASVWEGWSRYQKVDVIPNISLGVGTTSLPLPVITLQKRYRDAVSVRLGAEIKTFDWLIARAGGWIETSAIQPQYFDLSTPDAFKVGWSLGVSAQVFEGIFLDATYAHMLPQTVVVKDSKLVLASLVPGSAAASKPLGNATYDFSSVILHFGVRVALFGAPPLPSSPDSEPSVTPATATEVVPAAAAPAADPVPPDAAPSTSSTTPVP